MNFPEGGWDSSCSSSVPMASPHLVPSGFAIRIRIRFLFQFTLTSNDHSAPALRDSIPQLRLSPVPFHRAARWQGEETKNIVGWDTPQACTRYVWPQLSSGDSLHLDPSVFVLWRPVPACCPVKGDGREPQLWD